MPRRRQARATGERVEHRPVEVQPWYRKSGHAVLAGAGAGGDEVAGLTCFHPKHLAEKILTSKSALEGERKQVTILFADLKGSMELLTDRDPEEARKILDPVLERMMEAVHRYEARSTPSSRSPRGNSATPWACSNGGWR